MGYRLDCNMPNGYYMSKQKKANNRYDGLLSPKQLADLEGETDLQVVKKVNKGSVKKMVTEQKKNAVGATFANPYDFTDY